MGVRHFGQPGHASAGAASTHRNRQRQQKWCAHDPVAAASTGPRQIPHSKNPPTVDRRGRDASPSSTASTSASTGTEGAKAAINEHREQRVGGGCH